MQAASRASLSQAAALLSKRWSPAHLRHVYAVNGIAVAATGMCQEGSSF